MHEPTVITGNIVLIKVDVSRSVRLFPFEAHSWSGSEEANGKQSEIHLRSLLPDL
jgi:hypothetical protein